MTTPRVLHVCMCLIEIVLHVFTVHQAVAASTSTEIDRDVETSEEHTQGDYGHYNYYTHDVGIVYHGVAASISWCLLVCHGIV